MGLRQVDRLGMYDWGSGVAVVKRVTVCGEVAGEAAHMAGNISTLSAFLAREGWSIKKNIGLGVDKLEIAVHI